MTPIEHGLVAVVDDDASNRSALWRLLVAHGYLVKTFATAEEFLRSSELDHAVCLVADINLGEGMSGLELGETILASGRGTSIVFMTGSADATVRRRARSIGCVVLLEKPFSGEELLEAIAKVIAPER